MTPLEFSNNFTVMLNSYHAQADFGEQSSVEEIVLDEYEKSFFLTKAQEEVVLEYYRDSFETTEEIRRQLDALVKTKIYTDSDKIEGIGVSDNSVFFQLPEDLAFITLEQVTCSECIKRVNVLPVKQDEYNKIKNNPFRGVTKYKALRLDSGNNIVEIIAKEAIKQYIIRYVSKLEPIILETLPGDLTIGGMSDVNECKLNPMLHKTILDRAVVLALQSKGIHIK